MRLRHLINTFRAVRWSSALQVEDYQRLRLRLLGAEMVVSILVLVGIVLYTVGTGVAMSPLKANLLFAALVVVALITIPLMLTILLQIIKLDLARLRNFNIPPARAIGVLVAAFAVMFALEVADTKHGTQLTLWYGLLWTVGYGLYSYYVFFVASSKATCYAIAAPFTVAPGRNERMLQFLFQIVIWFNILLDPISYAFQN